VPALDAGHGSSAEGPVRRPDGVSLDPPPALPSAVSRARSGGVVALRAPVSRDAVMNLLSAFFDAWQREAIDSLVALLCSDAGPFDARARGSRALVEGWRQRMRAHEYGRIAGLEMVRPERVERWEPEQLGAEGAPPRTEVRAGELVVRVPVEAPVVGGDRLFGDAVELLVRPEEGRLKIAAYAEVEGR
jgi:hypothetical protein